MILHIRHTGIVVSDLSRSIHFYTDLLGFHIISQVDEPGAFIDKILGLKDTKLTTVKMSDPKDQKIELLFFHSHEEPHTNLKNIFSTGITHFAVTVEDVDHTYKTLLGLGIEFINPPVISPDGHAIVTFCKDPDGNYIEIVQTVK